MGLLWESGGLSKKSDRKSTRLHSSHLVISYAVFCLKKKHCAEGRGGRRSADARRPQRREARGSPVRDRRRRRHRLRLRRRHLRFFFFRDTATTDIYTLSLHDALPI